MFKYKLLLLILLLIFFSKNVNASVVINEIFPNPSGSRTEPNEFVELMNLSVVEIDISGYKLQDSGGKEYVISETIMGANGFAVFRRDITKIALNNDEDEVILISKDGEILDTFSYQETKEDRSWSRVPDGIGEFYANTEVSEGEKNSDPPTPTPDPTAKPTASPKPTKTPKPTVTQTPTKLPTQQLSEKTQEAVFGNTSVNEETRKVRGDGKIDQKITQKQPDKKKELDDILNHRSDTEAPEVLKQKDRPFGAGLIILGGLGFIGAAGYPIIKKKGIIHVFKRSEKT